MNSVMINSIALIILVLFIFLLPLGFTKIGKAVLMILSIFLAFTGAKAYQLFNIWQTAGILIVLVFLFTYLLTRQFNSTIFVDVLENEENMRENSTFYRQILNENNFIKVINNQYNQTGNTATDNEDKDLQNSDDEQIEDFFENRFALIHESEDKFRMQRNLLGKNSNEMNSEYNFEQNRFSDNNLSEQDYIIQEINFSQKDSNH